MKYIKQILIILGISFLGEVLKFVLPLPIPAGVGIMTSWGLLKPILLPVSIVTVVTITVAVIIITGVIGNMIGELICRIFRIHEPISKGLAFGASAHAIGTAKAIEIGEVEGAMSGLAIAVSGIFTVIFASFFASLM